jgi:glycosidase
VRLTAEKDDLVEVVCLFADKYESGAETTLPLRRESTDGIRDYWSAVLPVPTSRLRYCFMLRGKVGEPTFLSEQGFSDKPPRNANYAGYFFYPYDQPIDRFALPRWVLGTTFYLIFPDRFANGDPSIDPAWVRPWGEKPTGTSFFGGDLAGIRARLPWLSELGVGCLYLTPVFAAPSNHKYDPSSYEQVDPGFGTADDLRALVAESHGAHLRVLLDGVFNHSGEEWPPFKDVREHGEQSGYKNWFFKIAGFPVDVGKVNYETFANRLANHPKLNTANAELREYLTSVGERWIRDADIDGWRLDVANEVDHRFWRAFRDRVKAAKPDAFIVGEVWHDAIRWLDGAQFDSVMHYPWRDAVLAYLRDEINPSAFAARTTTLRHLYEPLAEPGLLHLLGSHDTPRIRTELHGRTDRARQAAVLLLTASGAPLVYYGDEVGMEGGADPDNRRCMQWDQTHWEQHILHAYRTLTRARRDRPWLAWGEFTDLITDDDRHIYAYRRAARGTLESVYGRSDEELVVVLNTGRHPTDVSIPLGGAWRDLLTEQRYGSAGGSGPLALRIKAGDAFVLVPASM